MKVLAVLAVCFAAVSASSLFHAEWEAWKEAHGKVYDFDEEQKRLYIWEQNLRTVVDHNMEADNGVHTYRLGMNEFADMDSDEWRDLVLSKVTRPLTVSSFCNMTYEYNDPLASKAVDWRSEGYVTPVKNQKECGSCWAFSTTGSLEGQHFKKTGKLVSLSEQNLIDCSTKQGNRGCQDGAMDFGFEYIKENGGIDTEESYPYTGENGVCHFKKADVGATLVGYVDIAEGDEGSLKSAVSRVGPVSVAIDSDHHKFRFYRSGVYYERKCSSTRLNHAMLAVGYGQENGEDYWLVKNSWGTTWGMSGYVMMSRNRDNNCGIATRASYPIV